MRLRSPAEFYLKFLICHPDSYANAAIKAIMEEVDLDYISDEYCDKLRSRCSRPIPFYPKDKLHGQSQKFILKEGLRSAFLPDQDMKRAWKLLDTPRAKEFIEAMLLSHAPPVAIADALHRHRGVGATLKAIEYYKHYFWNVDLLDSTQMRALLNFRQECCGARGEGSTKEQRAEYDAAKKASYLDPRRLAADLPFSPLTALMAQMRMGTMPNKLETARTLEIAQSFAILRAAEASMYGSLQDSSKALNFSIVAKNMTEILEKVVKPDEHLREDLQKIALRTDNQTVPSIHQLSDGRHTVDMHPLKETIDVGAELDGGAGSEGDQGEGDPECGEDPFLPGG